MLRRIAHAKINLTLYVLGKRPDGFHELHSIVSKVTLGDEIHFAFAEPAEDLPLTRAFFIECSDPSLPTGPANLVYQAAELVQEASLAMSCLMQPIRIALHKRIPAGGGLGGGSSDAASTLEAINELCGQPLSRATLMQAAAVLGSDVAFFLASQQALMCGRGDRLIPMDTWPFHAVLICPPFGCNTASVYHAFAAGARPALPARRLEPRDLWLGPGSPRLPSEISPHLCNMLYPAACVVEPRLPQLAQQATQLCRQIVHMSGSGSTLFVLADSAEHASSVAGCLAPLRQNGCELLTVSNLSADD